MNRMRKSLAWLLSVCMVIVMLPATAMAASYTDVSGHWAQAAIEKWSDLGIIQGSEGRFHPDHFITRGEMAVIIDRVMQYQTEAPNAFSDLGSSVYTDAILKANAAGVILGNGITIRPTDNITREEAAVMLGRALGLTEYNVDGTFFTDSANISSWALGYVNALAAKGYIHGSNGRFRAGAFITRAEIITILDNAITEMVNQSKEYTGDVTGTVVVNSPGATLSNMKISGDLIISEGVGAGDVTLDNVNVTGNTIVRGGGANSIHITGGSQLANIVIKKTDSGDIRVVTSDGSVVNAVYVDDGSDDVILTGSFQNVTVEANVGVKAIDAKIGSIAVQSAKTKLDVDKNSSVQSVHIADTATGSALTVSGSVGTLTADGQVSVNNQGTIAAAEVNADFVVLDGRKPSKIKIGSTVESKPTDSSGNTINGTTTNSSSGSGGGVTSVQLATPSSLAWDTATPGKATWAAVPNASSYTVQIYKDGIASGTSVTGITNAYYNFTSVITKTGTYTFDVKAIGSGSYTDSAASAKSAGYSYTASIPTSITGVTIKARHEAGVLAAEQPAQVNDNKFTVGQVQQVAKTYNIPLTGTQELTAEKNPGGASGKWIGVRIQLAGITDISTVSYSTDNVSYNALSADDAIAADARANSFMFYMNGENTQETRYIKGADNAVITLNFTFAPYVAPQACPALKNGVSFADDDANDTDTVITLGDPSVAGDTFVYRISEDENVVATPYVGDDLSAWTAVETGTSIEAANGKHIGVAEVDNQKKAVQFTDAQAVTEAEPSSDAGLTTVLSGSITATGTGTSDSPKTASVSVASGVATVGRANITAAANATFNLYSGSGFSTEITDANTIDLAPGAGTDIYVKVTAENGTACYYQVTVTRAAVQLGTPATLAWDTTTPGKATWDAVPNASSYTVSLFKDAGATAVDTKSPTSNFYDFTDAIASNGTGSYTFIVAALGDGTHYTNGVGSDSSLTYAYTAPAITGVTMSPKTAAVAQGDTQQLAADVTVVGGAAATVSWTSSDTNGKVTVDSNGLVTVAADAAAGTYTITATSTFDGTKSDTCAITVTQKPADMNSGITNWATGELGSKQIILTMTVKDAAGAPITGLGASAFAVRVNQNSHEYTSYAFNALPFSGFVDHADGTYTVVFTGDANYTTCLFNNLTVNGVTIEVGDKNTFTPMGVPPTLQSAAVGADGTVVTMTFNKEMLNPDNNQSTLDCFTAKVNGQARTFSAIAMNSDGTNTKFDLTLSGSPVITGDTITLSYSSNRIMSADNGFLQTITDYTVTNNSTMAGSLTVSSAAAGTATGTTVVTVAETAGAGDTFVYKVSSAEVTGVKVGDTVTEGTAFTSALTEISVTADQYVTIYEINGTSNVVKYVSRKIVYGEFKPASSDAGLTTVLSGSITATGTGTSDSPKTASVSVASGVATAGRADITAAASATFNLYSDSGFLTEITDANTIDLASGAGTDIYVKVTAEDGTACYYKVTVNRAAIQLGTPATLAWDTTTPGKATWDAVPNASSYTVSLFKDAGATAVDTESPTDNFYDFTDAIASNGTGSYTFIVAALGDGTHYTNGVGSDSSLTYAYTAPAITGVTMSPKTAAVAQGDTQQLAADVTVVGGAAAAVSWTSSDTNGKVTVDSNGLVTVAADAAAGTYTITATSTFDGTKSDTCAITVTQKPADAYSGITNQVNGALGSKQVTLTVTVKDAAGAPITGLTASAFTAQVKSGYNIFSNGSFAVTPFSSFADHADGTYTVVFTGGSNYSYYSFNSLTAAGVTIETGSTGVTTPAGVPPVLQSAAVGVDGAVVTMTFDKEMFSPRSGDQELFTAKVNGQDRTFSAITLNSDGTNTKFDLTLNGSPVIAGDTVTLTYNHNLIESTDFGMLQTIAGYTVTNNSTMAGSLTVSSAAAGTATGTTVVTVAETAGAGDTFAYKVGSAEVTGLKVSDTLTDGTAFTSALTEISVTADQYVTIYEINGTSNVVKYVSRKIVSGEFKPASSDAGLTTVLSSPITATGTGTSDSPKTASVSVASGVATAGRADITVAASATFKLYSDSGFLTEITDANTIDLASGAGTDIYVKVTAEDGTACYYKVTVNRAAIQLGTPATLAWDTTTPGKATWDAVPNASSYTVSLFKDAGATAVDTQSTTSNSYDFTDAIALNGTGNYTFTVMAMGDQVYYTNSAFSAKSSNYIYASSDAGLATVLSQSISATGTGTSDSPKTASIDAAYSADTLAKANIAATDSNATVYFYGTDITFGTEDNDGVALTAGTPITVYIKITAQDTTTSLYYAVTITRAKPVISIGTQPDGAVTVTAGSISESLSAAATVTEGSVNYQWYSAEDTGKTNPQKIDGKTDASFSIPTELTAGTYYYFCRVSATDADDVDTNVATVTVEGTDSTMPTVGNSGVITTNSVMSESLTLNWTKAADNKTSEANLKYYVYQSGSDNIGTPEDCVANGTLLNVGGTADVNTYNVTSLTPSSTYYFNVMVEDEAGNKAAYVMVSATTLAA